MNSNLTSPVQSEDLLSAPAKNARCPDCADKDEDCAEVPDKVKCWLYAPERGMCPYLRQQGPAEEPKGTP